MTPEPHATSPQQLLVRAGRLRHRAAELERAAGARTDDAWLDVLHGHWPTIRAVSRSRLAMPVPAARATDHVRLAVASALLGDVRAARGAAADAESLAPDDLSVVHGTIVARAMSHLVSGEPAASVTLLLELPRTGGTPFAGVGLVAGSAYRAGRPTAAAHLLDVDDRSASPAVRDEYAVARAYVGEENPGAAALPHAPFARGRVALARGLRRRRARDEAAARAYLATALDLFRSIGATPWTQFAANELRASGHRVAAGAAELTDRQLAIVRLASLGFSNQQIADRLFLSTRTVGTHLYRAFPKLGVTSRNQLARALHER